MTEPSDLPELVRLRASVNGSAGQKWLDELPDVVAETTAFGRSVLAHRIANGRGCAELIDHDELVPAMLIERLGPNLHDLGLSITAVLVHEDAHGWNTLAAGSPDANTFKFVDPEGRCV